MTLKFSLYLGGSDTIATTMRWVLVCLVENPDAQEKSREEIQAALSWVSKIMSRILPLRQSNRAIKDTNPNKDLVFNQFET